MDCKTCSPNEGSCGGDGNCTNFSSSEYHHHRWEQNIQMWLQIFSRRNYVLWIGIGICCLAGNAIAGFACLSNPCVFGVCIDDLNSSYSCYCIDGYTGIQCQTNWDECWSAPCQNGGMCIDGVAQYNCSCPEGFTGQNCEENVDECLSNPCQNGGICIDKNNGYTCSCQPGYLGSHCEIDVAVCETGNGERCHNGGECIEGKGLEFTCDCAPGWTGAYCDSEIDECESGPCQNGAVCVDKLAHYLCACPTGYTGNNCEEEIMVCSDSPCSNSALCLMEEGLPVCYCVPDFHGEKCEYQYDECQLMAPRCANGGTCIDGVDDFTCSCPSGITGLFCECLVLDNGDMDCNYTAPETTTVPYSELDTLGTTSSILFSTHFSTSIASEHTDEFTDSTVPNIKIVTVTPTDEIMTTDWSGRTTYIESSTMTIDPLKGTTFDVMGKSTTQKDERYTTIEQTTESTSDKSYETSTIISQFSSTIFPSTVTFSTLTPFFTQNPQLNETKFTYTSDDEKSTINMQDTTVPSTVTITPVTFDYTESSARTSTIVIPSDSSDCTRTPCFNGGTCVRTSEGVKCVCRFDRQGPLCEIKVNIQKAAFGGDSYLSHRIHPNSQQLPSNQFNSMLSMVIEVKARTRATDGLILLAVAQGIKGNHYMALFLHKGLLQFQFSCGLQTMLLSELEIPVNTGHEILIQAGLDFSHNRTHCNASLRVNKTLAMSGEQPTWLNLIPYEYQNSNIIQNTWLHLGGTPQAPIGLINGIAGGQGFTGCLYSLKINRIARNIYRDAVDGFGITECGSLVCLSNPCRNGAICIEVNENTTIAGKSDRADEDDIYTQIMENDNKQPKILDKWKCKCPTGYMGSTCEISVCDDNPCQYGATCVTFPGSGYLCLCPFGKHGHYCEHNLEIAQPHFSGSVNGLASYVAYPVPLPLEYSIELNIKIIPSTLSQISILAFLGQNGFHDEKSDHLVVSFIQGYIMLTWNLGSGPRRIFTQKPIEYQDDNVKSAIDIKVGRIGREAWLSVDGKVNISGKAPGTLTRMDVVPILYLGGHDIVNFSTLPHDLPLHSGFQGCIFDVHLKAGLVTVPLQENRGIRGRGVGQCATRECHRHACQNDGACLHHGATFSCICQDGWYGPLCSQSMNPCDSSNNQCGPSSTCIPLVNGYECDCPLGKTGRNCDQEIKSLTDISLTGRRSYLTLKLPPKPQYPQNSENEIDYLQSLTLQNATTGHVFRDYKQSSNHPILMRLTRPSEVKLPRAIPALMVSAPSDNQHHRVQYFSVEFEIRPLSERGLLLYYGEFNGNLGKPLGFLSLSLQGGVVEFRISSSNEHIQIVRSIRMLAIGEWHKIKITQSGRRLTLWVEGTASAALASSGEVLINKDALMYIGGLPDLSKLPFNAISGFPMPFRGCVRQLTVNGVRIVLNVTNILESQNINDCDGTPCGGDYCESNGQCWLDETMHPHCKCPDNAKGERCEQKESCRFIKCKNNGKCSKKGKCDCPNGWSGFYCEIATTKNTIPSFRGNSFLIVPSPKIPTKDKRNGPVLYNVRSKDQLSISVNFSTINLNGLLIWSSKNASKFIGLGVQNGHIKLASNLLQTTNSTIDIPTGGFVSDGGWHSIQLDINAKAIKISLDGRLVFTMNRKIIDLKTIDDSVTENNNLVDDTFFIGGFPNNESVESQTFSIFSKTFIGCLQALAFGNDDNLLINDFSKFDGENIGSCDLYDDFSNA